MPTYQKDPIIEPSMNNFITESNLMFDFTQKLRRDFHQHPELGFQEVRTSSIVAQELSDLGLDVRTGIAETGVVALLDSKKTGPTALLRFDMDALPIQEQSDAPYASLNPGVMHACGHDGHTAIGLTVAKLLHKHIASFRGKVKLVFQPAEEGLGGAERMVAEGVLKNPRPDFTLTLHLWNDKQLGWLGITPGPVMAASEIFNVKITGKGGHGAAPHLAVDPLLASAQVISALQSIVARDVPPLQTAVVSVTAIQCGEAFNVIPSEAQLKGTIRTFDSDVRNTVLTRFNDIVTNVSTGMGCKSEVELQSITPAVINDPSITESVQNIAEELFPDDTIDNNAPTMGSEDMAFMMQEIPGCYFFIGSANSNAGLDASHHNPKFDFDERALPKGAALMTAAVIKLLNK